MSSRPIGRVPWITCDEDGLVCACGERSGLETPDWFRRHRDGCRPAMREESEATDLQFDIISRSAWQMETAVPNDCSRWASSPFEWLTKRPSRQVGAIGEEIISLWLHANGLGVKKSGSNEFDRLVAGKPVEMKFSTLWNNGRYSFQQVRDHAYDMLICMGVSPRTAHCWAFPKKYVMECWESGVISSQHRGKSGIDTCWFQIDPCCPPKWVEGFGGSLDRAVDCILRILGDQATSAGLGEERSA
jgi:hypothetical protein